MFLYYSIKIEYVVPLNLYDDRKVSLRRPHGNGDLDIVRASYTRRKANVTEALTGPMLLKILIYNTAFVHFQCILIFASDKTVEHKFDATDTGDISTELTEPQTTPQESSRKDGLHVSIIILVAARPKHMLWALTFNRISPHGDGSFENAPA